MSLRSAVTISLVPEARGGPFVFWDDLPAAVREAKRIGFDAVELFPPGPDAINPSELRTLLDGHGLQLAAVGTGAGWVKHRLHLASADAATRRRAIDFVAATVEFAGAFQASAIIGSMQGRSGGGVSHDNALGYLADALQELGERAASFNVPLLYEPLNRYETDQVTTVAAGLAMLNRLSTDNVRLLCDLFHMNIEEADIAAALRAAGGKLGHVHFVDTNRRAVGFGHLNFDQPMAALREIGYANYLSAEVLPLPDPTAAAEQTMRAFRSLVH